MDQRPLVENQIDAGFGLVKRLVGQGFSVAAAGWVRPRDEGEWTLYIASKVFDENGAAVAYRQVAEAVHQLEDPWVSMSEVKVIGARDATAEDMLRLVRRHPGPMATRTRGPTLGALEIEEAYLYPPAEEAARRPPPKVRILGIKAVADGTATKEVAEEVGCVEGFIGEPEFNSKFASLIKSKFGSPEQFAVAYPRIVLEKL